LLNLFVLLLKQFLKDVDILVEFLDAFLFVRHFIGLVFLALVSDLCFQRLQVFLACGQASFNLDPEVYTKSVNVKAY